MVEARHLRRLAADQRAAVRCTAAGESLDDLRKNVWLQLTSPEVIEEEKGLGSQHCNVVHAVVHQVFANRVVAIHREGNLQLRTHAIDARDEDRLLKLPGVESEQAAEPTHLPHHLAAMRGREQLRQGRLHPVAKVDIHTSARVCFLFHEGSE